MLGNDKISILYSVYHIFYVMQRNLCFIAVYLLKSDHCLYCPSYIAITSLCRNRHRNAAVGQRFHLRRLQLDKVNAVEGFLCDVDAVVYHTL